MTRSSAPPADGRSSSWLRLSEEDWKELRVWWSIVWPTWITFSASIVMDFTDSAILGHFKGGDLLPAASSSLIIIDFTSSIFARGPCGAVSTLSANAYGAGQDELAGRRLQMAALFALSMACCLAPAWVFGGSILGALANSSVDASLVDSYGTWRLIGLPAAALSSVLQSWLSGRKRMAAAMISASGAALLNIPLNYLLVFGAFGMPGFGLTGSAIATAASSWVTFVCLFVASRDEIRRCWPSNFMPTFSKPRVADFVKLCVPLTLSGVLEELNMQITAVMAVSFGAQELATHNCMLVAFMLLSTALIGVSNGTATRISHLLVENNVVSVKRLIRNVMCIAFGWSLVVMVVFIVLQDRVGMLFSANPRVWELSGQLASLVGVAYFMLSSFYVSMSVLEGIAKPNAVMAAFLVGCYGVGLPVAYTVGFQLSPEALSWWPYFDVKTASGNEPNGCGILGLWLGLAAGYFVTTLVVGVRVLTLRDWDGLVAKAQRMAELNPQDISLVEAAAS
eukprot:TRINITY_DN27439_c0_g1_i1.p1 TRINITY_DN27439_c0_g1~~TRINITY_DN27439_c0_g1_i1.p1  ORF type:complete len:528 (+),score=88.30 TRINITY_DN27439_c0_g1_i1:58-1584(+)